MIMRGGTVNGAFYTGNLTREIKFHTSGDNRLCAFFTLASDNGYTDRDNNSVDRSEFISFCAFGKQAERLQRQNPPTGSRLTVDGHLVTEKKDFIDPKSGQPVKITITSVQVDSWQFTERKSVADSRRQNQGAHNGAPQQGGYGGQPGGYSQAQYQAPQGGQGHPQGTVNHNSAPPPHAGHGQPQGNHNYAPPPHAGHGQPQHQVNY